MSYKKYSEIVTLRESKPAYNIQDEENGEWSMFIANEQFNSILQSVIKSVYNNDVDNHKSFWISGTYGNGKSHAAAVLKHLLCDPLEEIQEYINSEYREPKYEGLRNNLIHLRKQKRLLPVMLYGQESIAYKDNLSLELQRAITNALKKAGITIVVKTDFENYIEHINQNPDFWNILIEKNPELDSLEYLKKKLTGGDTSVFGHITDALRKGNYHITLVNNNIAQWIFEVQDKLAEGKVYDGFLIIWDEFTEVLTSPIGPTLLVEIQNIAEQTMNSRNNSYFLFVSHPSALNSIREEEREKTKGRYHYITYNMETVSAFKIMSRKFKLTEDEKGLNLYRELSDRFYKQNSNSFELFSEDSSNKEQTYKDMCDLFPLHPSTANLATYYAREAGSSSRSVFEFLGANPAIREFLESEEHFANGDTITADYLWDYVVEEFRSKPIRFAPVTERFNSYTPFVEKEGKDYMAVFKGILLLNALNNIANDETVTPSEKNIRMLFVGTSIEKKVDDILEFFNTNSIIQRAPGGVFSIQFSALPVKEIDSLIQQLSSTQYKYTSEVVNFAGTAREELDAYLTNVARARQFNVYSLNSNEFTLLNMIEKGYQSAKKYEIFIAALFARNEYELQELKKLAKEASQEERFRQTVFIVFENVLTNPKYERFIEYQANAVCSKNHGLNDQQQAHSKAAKEMIKEWMGDVRRNNFTYYLGGKEDIGACQRLAEIINESIAPVLFPKGVESLDIIRMRYSKTYWEKKSYKNTVDIILSFHSKDEIYTRCKGAAQHIQFLLQDSVDDNLNWLPTIDKNHPLYVVNKFVDEKFEAANKTLPFNLGEMLKDLSYPPYGLYQTYASMGMLAFAMRKYVKQIFDTNGKPREAKHLVEDIVEVFKTWENGSFSNKLTFMFETSETRELFNEFVSLFQLQTLKEYTDISSLTDARWAIRNAYLKNTGYPLWALKYSKKTTEKSVKNLIDSIIKVCEETGARNQELISEALSYVGKFRINLGNLLKEKENFQKGFVNFLKTRPDIGLKDEEVEGAIDYIKKHLEKEVGFWTEAEVEGVLKSWRIAENNRAATAAATVTPESSSFSVATETPSSEWTERRTAIKQKIEQLSDMAIAKEMLEEICEKGDETILNIISRYV